jgi:hypothetical protein
MLAPSFDASIEAVRLYGIEPGEKQRKSSLAHCLSRVPYHGQVPPHVVEYVFIDTQVFVATGFGFNGKPFQALRKHLETRRLRLVLTDITVSEVHAQIERHVSQELVAHRKFLESARVLRNAPIPEAKGVVQRLNVGAVARSLREQFDGFLAESHVSIVSTSNLKAGDVLNKYFAVTPPFGAAENKRREFPDAFVIEALNEWAYEGERTVFVVSGDKLFREACQNFPLRAKETLEDVLDEVASDNEHFASLIRRHCMDHLSDIEKAAKDDFQDRYYWVEDQDGDAEIAEVEVESAPEPQIIEINLESATVHLDMTCEYSAHLSYIDSDSSIYSEGELAYADQKEEDVRRQQEFTVEILVTYERMDADTFEIENIRLIDPSDGFGIKTDNDGDWPYK